MFYAIPSNSYTWLVGSVVFGLFGWRAWHNYRKLHNPLSKLFAYSGFSASFAFFFWSVPFLFSNNTNYLIAINIIGDFFLYTMFFLSAKLLHYIAFRNKTSAKVVLIPAAIVATVGFLANCYGYIHNGVSVSGGTFEYTLPLLSDVAQAILIVITFLVGVMLLTKVSQQATTRAKASLIGIAFLYMLSSIAGGLNVLLSGSSNESPTIIASYVAGFVIFVSILASVRLLKK